jgi:hypothetical protein
METIVSSLLPYRFNKKSASRYEGGLQQTNQLTLPGTTYPGIILLVHILVFSEVD